MSEKSSTTRPADSGDSMTGEDAMMRDRSSALYRATGKFNRSTVLMSLMFAVGIGWVIWESQQIEKPDQETEGISTEVVVESGIEAMRQQVHSGEESDAQTSAMVEAIYYEPRQRQIERDQLRQNPFGVEEPIVEIVEAEPEPEVVEAEPEKPKAPPVDGLNLQSVVLSDPPSAMISGAIVREGQVINRWRVVKIERRKVTLQWNDEFHILQMDD